MAPAPGDHIVDTLLAVYLSADGQTPRLNRNQWIITSFKTEEIMAGRNKLKKYLDIADNAQYPATRKSVDNALSDIGTWVREADSEGIEIKAECDWRELQRAAALLANQELLGPNTVVPLSTRMGCLEKQMKDVITNLSTFREEAVKHWTGPAESGGGVASVPMPTATSFASVLQQPAPPMEVGHGGPHNPQVSESLAAQVAAFAATRGGGGGGHGGQGYLQVPQSNAAQVTPQGGGGGGHWNVVGPDGRAIRNRGRGVSPKRNADQMEGAADRDKSADRRGGRPRAPVSFGSARIDIAGAEAAPVDFFIGNTHPDTDEAKIKEVLVKCGSIVQGDNKPDMELKVENLKAVCLNSKIENPRTKCWKVTVPHVWREFLRKDDFYPRGWSHRPFHHGVGRKPHEGNKRPRQDGAGVPPASGVPETDRTTE